MGVHLTERSSFGFAELLMKSTLLFSEENLGLNLRNMVIYGHPENLKESSARKERDFLFTT